MVEQSAFKYLITLCDNDYREHTCFIWINLQIYQFFKFSDLSSIVDKIILLQYYIMIMQLCERSSLVLQLYLMHP